MTADGLLLIAAGDPYPDELAASVRLAAAPLGLATPGLRLVRAVTMDDDCTFLAGLADLVTAALRQPVGIA